MTKNDIYVAIGVVVIALFMLFINFKKDNPNYLTIEKDGILIYEIALPANEIIKIKDEFEIEIKERKIRVIKSSCPNKICIGQGWVSAVGRPIICVPLKIVAELK